MKRTLLTVVLAMFVTAVAVPAQAGPCWKFWCKPDPYVINR